MEINILLHLKLPPGPSFCALEIVDDSADKAVRVLNVTIADDYPAIQ